MRYFIILFFMLSQIILAKEESSISIYTKKISEFSKDLDIIEQEIKDEEQQLKQLAANLINNEIHTSSIFVKFVNVDSNYFKISSIDVKMNGESILNKKNVKKSKLSVFSGAAEPGVYIFDFVLKIKGAGYSVFSYMEGYQFTIRKSIRVTVPIIGRSSTTFSIYKVVGENDPNKLLGVSVKTQ